MSLRSRLVCAVAVVSVIALIAAEFATYSALRSFLYSRSDQSLQQVVGTLLPGKRQRLPSGPPTRTPPTGPGASGGPVGAGTVPGTAGGGELRTGGGQAQQPSVAALAKKLPGMFVEVRSTNGVLVGPFPDHVAGGAAYAPVLPSPIGGFSSLAPTVPPEVFFEAKSTVRTGPEFLVLAVREQNDNVLIVATSLADTTSTLSRLIEIAIVVIAGALLAVLALGWWSVRVGLRPLMEVESTAEQIAEGELASRVPGESDRTEVGRLARTLNRMLERIEGAFAERDVTEAQLRASEDRLRRFAADASHELRTPLAAVSAYAELFDRGARDRPEDLERVIHGIQGETARMKVLVEDLLLLARLDQGRPLEMEPVDLARVAADATQAARVVGSQWLVHVETFGDVMVMGDALRLRQVLDNLLANVRAHTPEGTQTWIEVLSTTTVGEGAVISVSDNGPGIAQEHEARIFERFYRAEFSRSRSPGGSGPAGSRPAGSGLGLSIVESIVAAHGGSIEVSSRSTGGTTMTVRLPGNTTPSLPDPA